LKKGNTNIVIVSLLIVLSILVGAILYQSKQKRSGTIAADNSTIERYERRVKDINSDEASGIDEELERIERENEETERRKKVEMELIEKGRRELDRLEKELEVLVEKRDEALRDIQQMEKEGKRMEEKPQRARTKVGLIGSYVARIGDSDKFSSTGVRLQKVSEIIRQDRANYYRFHSRDDEDMPDNFFFDVDNRAVLESMLERGSVSEELRREILYGNPLIKVYVYRNHIDLELLR
jgi:chromosome segregation ATPase